MQRTSDQGVPSDHVDLTSSEYDTLTPYSPKLAKRSFAAQLEVCHCRLSAQGIELYSVGNSCGSGCDRWCQMQGLKYTLPSDRRIGDIDVTAGDLDCLKDREWLNDTILDYRLKVIQGEYRAWHAQGITRPKVHYQNAFFYSKLAEADDVRFRPNSCRPVVMSERYMPC